MKIDIYMCEQAMAIGTKMIAYVWTRREAVLHLSVRPLHPSVEQSAQHSIFFLFCWQSALVIGKAAKQDRSIYLLPSKKRFTSTMRNKIQI